MENDPLIWKLILQVFLISINALFAAAEIAVISMNDNKLAKLTAEGNVKAARLTRMTSQPARFFSNNPSWYNFRWVFRQCFCSG